MFLFGQEKLWNQRQDRTRCSIFAPMVASLRWPLCHDGRDPKVTCLAKYSRLIPGSMQLASARQGVKGRESRDHCRCRSSDSNSPRRQWCFCSPALGAWVRVCVQAIDDVRPSRRSRLRVCHKQNRHHGPPNSTLSWRMRDRTLRALDSRSTISPLHLLPALLQIAGTEFRGTHLVPTTKRRPFCTTTADQQTQTYE